MKRLQSAVQHGFSLIEVLLVLALVGVVAGLSVPVYQSFQVRDDLDIAANTTVQTLRRAQTLSQAISQDATWGVSVQSGSIVLFQGANFATRDTDHDEVFFVPTTITIAPASTTEFVFDKFTGEPQATGSLTLESTTNESRTVTLGEKGIIFY
jgi:prepilin-type N-terminal cleavage/methylation domain-containing protein